MRAGTAATATPPVRLRITDAALAERRVAGVASAAHGVGELRRRGARDVRIFVASGERLSRDTLDDIRRACPSVTVENNPRGPGVEVDFVPPSTRDVLLSTGKSSDGTVSRWINRPISRSLSRVLLLIPGIRPWHVTMAAAALGLAMFACLLSGGTAGLVAGAVLFQAASILDGVDGEIARATYRSSSQGAMLDTSVDMATNVGFFLGVTICLTGLYGWSQAIAGIGATALAAAGLGIMAWLARRIGDGGNFNFLKRHYRERFPTGLAKTVVDTLVTVTSRDFFALAIAVVIVLGWGQVVTFSLLAFALIWFGFILLAIRPILRAAKQRFEQPAEQPVVAARPALVRQGDPIGAR
jgi:CDP-L-myo-inositol myo-inositolphosphotransferase